MRYCPACDQTFGTKEKSFFNTKQSTTETINKTCEECGFGDCTENMWVNSRNASVIQKEENDANRRSTPQQNTNTQKQL